MHLCDGTQSTTVKTTQNINTVGHMAAIYTHMLESKTDFTVSVCDSMILKYIYIVLMSACCCFFLFFESILEGLLVYWKV